MPLSRGVSILVWGAMVCLGCNGSSRGPSNNDDPHDAGTGGNFATANTRGGSASVTLATTGSAQSGSRSYGSNTAAETSAGGSSAATAGTKPPLTERYPDESGLATDPAVLFHDDFEQGWGKWKSPSKDTAQLFIETGAGLAHAGTHYLRSTVTEAQLQAQEYISSSTALEFPRRVDTVYWRFYARFKSGSPTPHHWVRMSAGTEAFSSSGLANTVPDGSQGFWFDFDASTEDVFNFYVYWYKMRSGRCNDGSVTPGCAGDQGTTYHYGNVFRPPNQQPFARDAWFCVEIMAKANVPGSYDGAMSFWIDGKLIGDYRPGFPNGTWLRDSFHAGGCSYSACTPPVPFEGFDFRSSPDVKFKGLFLDAYYERDTTASKRAELEAKGISVISEQTIYYDDVVVATEPIGCGKFR